jgi:hypothetical protein
MEWNTGATTPIASPLILPVSLNQFFDLSQRRHSYSMVQIMSYEMMRLHSFKREFPVSAIKVVFFATGVVDEVKCFSCSAYYRNWQPTDIPHILHERLSPNCRLVDNAMSYQTIKWQIKQTQNITHSQTQWENRGNKQKRYS